MEQKVKAKKRDIVKELSTPQGTAQKVESKTATTSPEKQATDYDYSDRERITFFTRDQEGSVYGVVSIDKHCILDVTYNAIPNEMAVTMKSTSFRGHTAVEPVQNVKVEGRQKVPQASYTVRELYQAEGFNHTLTIQEEPDMRRLWKWLGHDEDMPFDTLMQIRKDMEAKIAKAKEEAEKKAAEAAAAAEVEKNKKSGILDATGEPIKK